MTDITIFNAEVSTQKYIASPFSVLDFDWYYHFQCGSFYTKVYYPPFSCIRFWLILPFSTQNFLHKGILAQILIYHIIANTIIFNTGLDATDLALHPEDKHLFRLAERLDVDACTSLFIKLGLSQTTWKNIQNKDRYDDTVKIFFALCKWKDLKYKQKSKPSFKELSDALAEDYHTHFICQVGNNCSHR
jgi:hypothetical protein